MANLVMPDFETEGEEADWWFENQYALAEEFWNNKVRCLSTCRSIRKMRNSPKKG